VWAQGRASASFKCVLVLLYVSKYICVYAAAFTALTMTSSAEKCIIQKCTELNLCQSLLAAVSYTGSDQKQQSACITDPGRPTSDSSENTFRERALHTFNMLTF